MSIQLLISTMHQTDHSLIERMHVGSDAVVINQCEQESREIFEFNNNHILWINTKERGLSKSRNMAIRNATADICMIADDDMVYRTDYVDIVTSAFARINADIVGFQVCGIEKKFKEYSKKEQRISYMKSMKMASVEIAFRRSIFEKNNIQFDELIGAGTDFLMGEENAMLFQCLHKGMTIFYTPKVIADLHVGKSTWFIERDERFFIGKGAAFAAMQPSFTSLLIIQWAIRKRKLYKDKYSFSEVVGFMRKGKKKYLEKAREKV